jgi:hypothetical protein
MKRRHFIGAATASVLAPVVLESQSFQALAAVSRPDDFAFFDERFEGARRAAASWTAPDRAIAVQGDVTSLWIGRLDRATRERALQLRGVTTESFRFCLGILVSEHARFDLSVSRIDRDLVLWTMRTIPKRRAAHLRAERRNG